jgi:signal-transduction protein with cAMP-binding, CBS, and nucleotidyltransferase domain
MTKDKSGAQATLDHFMMNACSMEFSFIDSNILCECIGALSPYPAVLAQETHTVEEVLDMMMLNKTGCVLVVDTSGEVRGIFSERDFVLKVAKEFEQHRASPIQKFMTRDPIVVTTDCTIAYALTLMSEGGFRNLPIVDRENRPRAVATIKDLVDFIVSHFMDKLLSFPTEV